jgi:hypothetical protein
LYKNEIWFFLDQDNGFQYLNKTMNYRMWTKGKCQNLLLYSTAKTFKKSVPPAAASAQPKAKRGWEVLQSKATGEGAVRQ